MTDNYGNIFLISVPIIILINIHFSDTQELNIVIVIISGGLQRLELEVTGGGDAKYDVEG